MKDLASALDKLGQEHLYRLRNISSGAQEVEPIINGKKVLSFCSNDYLGLANHPKIIEALIDGAKKFGVGAGASHLVTGHHQCHHILEEELADFIGCEKVLLFSTGYMANLGVVSSLANRNTEIFEDRLNHASLIDAGILSRAHIHRYKHNNVHELDEKLSATKEHSKLVLSDGVFSMDGTISQVAELQALAKIHAARLLIDDAHGIGVLGKRGKGCTEDLLIPETILIGTLGKAFGTFGAFVAARQELIEWLIQKAHSYIYTTALPPAVAEATRTSLRVIKEEPWRREELQNLIQYFRKCCVQVGISLSTSKTPIQPLVLGTSEAALNASEHLLNSGILVTAIRPPTVPNNTARLRISFSASHTKTHVDQLIVALEQSVL